MPDETDRYDAPMPRCELVVLVPHPDRPALLTPADDPTRLPATALDGEFRLPAALDAIRDLLGTLPPVLRVGYARTDADGEASLVIVDLETVGSGAPPGLSWTDRDAFPLGSIEPVELRAILPRWIARRANGPTPSDPPWARPGWFARASAWTTEHLAAAGMPAVGAPELVYSWGISMVLRTSTADGDVYLKATPPVFPNEAALTACLAAATPKAVTRLIAVDPGEGWLLMRDHGPKVVGDEPPEAWGPGLAAYAGLQRTWCARTETLVRAGAETRTLEALARVVPTLAGREPLATEFSDGERAEWESSGPAFVAACTRLAEIGPAPTLSHGDLHPWNVAVTPDGPLIFDWSDAAVAHPFLDLAVYVTRTKDIARRRALRNAYLVAWQDVLPPVELAEAGELALIVGALYQVESYRRILVAIDPDDRGGMEGATRSWALAAIATLRDGIEHVRTGHAD